MACWTGQGEQIQSISINPISTISTVVFTVEVVDAIDYYFSNTINTINTITWLTQSEQIHMCVESSARPVPAHHSSNAPNTSEHRSPHVYDNIATAGPMAPE